MRSLEQHKKKRSLNIHQEKAWLNFIEKGFPNKKVEAFKYNKLTKNDYEAFDYSLKSALPNKTSQNNSFDHPVHINLKNGQFELGSHNIMGINTQLLKLDNIFSSPMINSSQTVDSWSSLYTLNQVFSDQGYSIEVDKNTSLEEPYVIQHSIDESCSNFAVNNKNQIILNENSSATIVEFFDHNDENLPYFQNQSTDILCKENSHLTYIRIQNDSTKAIHQSSINVFQDSSSSSTIINFSLGAYRSRLDTSVQLLKDNANTNLYGLYFAKDKQFHDHYTNIYHGHENTFSTELFKGILDDHAEAAFAGKIYVEKDAQKIDSKQMNRNLMLSDDSSAYSVPQLEIFADDVKCAHGSTVGELNPDELFYLRSRGFSEREAKLALIEAYANEISQQCKVEFVQNYIKKYLIDNLYA